MNARNLWHGAIISSSLVGLVLAGTLIWKSYLPKPKAKIQSHYVKLDPSKVNQIKIIKPNRHKTKYARTNANKRGRRTASFQNSTINSLFSPFGPLKDLTSQERVDFKRQVISYVDSKIRRGSIEPRHRFRFIEMKVVDKSLELLEKNATH